LATVRRDGQVQTISAEQIVPGDVVILDSGDIIISLPLTCACSKRLNSRSMSRR
jgi:hypothetical protein